MDAYLNFYNIPRKQFRKEKPFEVTFLPESLRYLFLYDQTFIFIYSFSTYFSLIITIFSFLKILLKNS